MGIDRFVARMAGEPDLRQVIAFPEGLERRRSAHRGADADARRRPRELGIRVDRRSGLKRRAPNADEEVILVAARAARYAYDRGARPQMATEGPGRAGAPSLTSLPSYRGHSPESGTVSTPSGFARPSTPSAATQPSCRRSCASSRPPAASAAVEPTGHAVRMDALHLIRAAAEFADTIERDAQNASASAARQDRGRGAAPPERAAAARGGDRALPPGERAPARRDAERGPQRVARAAREVACRGHDRTPGSGGKGQSPPRAVAPPGNRAHERRPRRGRADARVGARAGRHRSRPRAARRRAAARGRRSRRGPRSARSRRRSCRPRSV